MRCWQFVFQIANSRTRWPFNFKGLSQHGGLAVFSKNIRASLFNFGLSNVPNFDRIHLAGHRVPLKSIEIFRNCNWFSGSTGEVRDSARVQTFLTYKILSASFLHPSSFSLGKTMEEGGDPYIKKQTLTSTPPPPPGILWWSPNIIIDVRRSASEQGRGCNHLYIGWFCAPLEKQWKANSIKIPFRWNIISPL